MQSIFALRNTLYYFEVDPSLAPQPLTTPAFIFRQTAKARHNPDEEPVILPAPDIRILNAFLVKTGWKDAIVGTKASELTALIDMPFEEDHLFDVTEAVSAYFHYIADDVLPRVPRLIARLANAKDG